MSLRPTTSGYLGFGSIVIPVRIYSASEDVRLHLPRVHTDDNGAVIRQEVCATCGKVLHTEDISKVYDVPTGEVKMDENGELSSTSHPVMFKDEEFKAFKAPASKQIRLVGFCDRREIDDLILDKPHFVGTGTKKEGGFQSFVLLREAMVKAGKVAIISWTSRGESYVGMMTPYGKGFLLKKLLYFDEARSVDDVSIEDAPVNPALVEKAVKLVEKLTAQFDHSQYTDKYAEDVRKFVTARIEGIAPEPVIETAVAKEVSSIEAQLEASLGL